MPLARKLNDEIFELRPASDRILYGAWHNNTFIILHHYEKKTNKIPKKELKTAEKRIKDFIRRTI
jgi:phage-related protein